MNRKTASEAFERLLEIIETLRAPGGCPWDREQTPLSLRSSLTEETYELIHAIQEGDDKGIREELGDVFLNAAMIGEMKEGEGVFKLADSLNEICDKLIRRHPHVYGTAQAESAQAVVTQWEEIKAQEKKSAGIQTPQSLLHKAGRGLPPLEKAQEVQKKAAKTGFDWPRVQDIFDKIAEETDEVRQEIEALEKAENPQTSREHLEMEVGDLLFSVVNLARFLKVDASLALNRSVEKFKSRFLYIETELSKEGQEPSPSLFERMDELWNEARQRDKSQV